LNWGTGLLSRDGYSIRISAEADHVDSVPTASRPTVARARVGFTHAGQNYEADSLKASAFTSPAWLYSPNTARNAFSSLYENGACVGTNVSYRGLNVACRQNQLPGFDIYPESSSQKLHALGELWLNNEATLYAEFLYGRQQEQIGINSWPAQSGRITNTPGSVGYAEMAANGMDTSYGFYYWQPNLTALRQRFEKSQMRSVMGVKGEWDNWNYNANVYHAVSKTEQNNELADYASLGITTTGLSNPLRDQRLLQPLDAQNSLTGQLLDSRYWERQATGQVTFSAAELRASKAIYELDGKDVLFGWGLEVRNEKVNSDFNSKLVTPSFQGERRNTAAYAELQIPVRSNWDVITSLRNDRYSDVGNTTNGKLATRWAINEAWAIRGGVGTGFRAPTIGQVQVVPENFALTTAALGACSAAMEGVISRLVSPDGMTVECPRNSNIRIFSNGNQDLRPEKSVQATLGLAMAPTRNLNVAVDYWRVQMRDTLQFESANAVLENPEKYASSYIVDPKVYLQNFGAIKIHYSGLLLKMKNLGESFKEGLDLDVRYRIPLDDARLTLGAQATYVMNSKERLSPDAEWISDLAKYSAGTDQVTPRVRGRITVALEKEGIGWQLNANYSSGYIDKDVRAFNIETGKTGNVTGRRVPSLTTWDFFGTYQVNRALQWRYGVVNLFDRQPPLSFYSVTNAVWGANSQYGSLMGRTLNVGMTYRF
jgi:iron complex outermembrane receptor protein